MPINVNDPEYTKAEKWFHEAKTSEEQLLAINKMLSHAPKHKGAENLLAQLRTKRKKLQGQIEKQKRSGKSTFKGIKKEEMQVAIIGNANSGKSSLLSILTNANPKISDSKFTTMVSQIGMMNYQGTNIQLIEVPAIESEYFDKNVANTADTFLILITKLDQINKIEENLKKTHGKRIIVFNKSDLLNEKEKRKNSATLQSKKYKFVVISCKTKENLEELKEKILQSFDKIRIYTKEPKKEKSNRPVILEPNSTVQDVAEKIFHGFSDKVKETKIWGPSSKFPGQKVGLKHKLKDLDVVEFKTK